MKTICYFWYRYSDLMFQWIVIAILGAVVYCSHQYHLYLDRGLIHYLNQHHCAKLGRAGQPEQFVYKCDNGLHLENDLRKEIGT